MTLENLHSKLDELHEMYKEDEYIYQKYKNYILNDLPNYLLNAKKSMIDREERRISLQSKHDLFVKQFINSNKYFYSNTSEIFFCYDHEHYSIIKEDTIIYNVLGQLRDREDLMPWKHKIKTSIIKNIKDIPILSSLPESATIQNVQNLFSNIFESKNETKYFLTIIGDIFLKKQNQNIHIIPLNSKNLLRTIENIGSQYFGHISILNSFKFKYHDHNYNDCRILLTKTYEDIEDLIFKNIINIVVVACYYSSRYTNSDNYIDLIGDIQLTERVLFLKNNTQDMIIKKFVESKIQSSKDSIISMKNMIYLWKMYLDEYKIPFIIPIANLKSLFKIHLKYDEEGENFLEYTSNKIPFISKFINFWDDTIIDDPNEYYIEIDEICTLFKNYCGLQNSKNIDINDNSILNVIKHFYPSTNIDGKYILGISCNFWNKQLEINKFLSKLYKSSDNPENTIYTLYELYTLYSSNCKKNRNSIIISKNYFDMYISNILTNKNQNIDFNMIKLLNFAEF